MTEPKTPKAPRSEVANTDSAELADRIKPLQSRVGALGPVDPDFDMKAFTDKLCEKDDR